MSLRLFNFKFVIVYFLLINSANSFSETFDENLCFNKNFKASISRKVFPFGLLSRSITVSKKDCVSSIEYSAFEFKKISWEVDVCREPVHIKKGLSSVEVLKYSENCEKNKDFCDERDSLLSIIQDEGLIFADGARENLDAAHGKVYCTFLLLSHYLNKGESFRRDQSLKGVLIKNNASGDSKETGEKPQMIHLNDSLNGDVDLSQKSENLFNF